MATRSSRCSRSYQRLNSASSDGSISIEVSSMPFPAIGMFDCPYRLMLEARSAIAFITASRTPGSYSEWPAPSTMRISASAPRRGQRMRGRRRAQQIIAALHDDAGNACELAGFVQKLVGSHEAVVLEIMRFHERRRGQGARRVQRIEIEPDARRACVRRGCVRYRPRRARQGRARPDRDRGCGGSRHPAVLRVPPAAARRENPRDRPGWRRGSAPRKSAFQFLARCRERSRAARCRVTRSGCVCA